MTTDIVVTGGLGFIGSAYIRSLPSSATVTNIDARTYAADPARLATAEARVNDVHLDIGDDRLIDVIRDARPKLIVHFAAASHVTRSETDAERFFDTNVRGTERVMNAAAEYGEARVIHISTDEVYGPAENAAFVEDDKQPGEGRATSAYARSKAVADDIVRSMVERIPVVVVRPTNCFGPWQHPEKAIARWTIRAVTGERVPVWGAGGQIRDWMFVDDAIAGLQTVIEHGELGEVYNLAPEAPPRTNLEIARLIARHAGCPEDSVYTTAYDRPSHDARYWIDSSRVRALGWSPAKPLEDRIAETVGWYRDNAQWWTPLVREAEALYDDSASQDDPTVNQ